MLYTGKGDGGSTSLFGCDQRLSKSSAIIEALGAVDELNSLIGVCRAQASSNDFFRQNLLLLQQHLFIVQAELAGAPKKLDETKVEWASELVNEIEKKLPPIKSFILAGSTTLGAQLDYARAVARRAERRVIKVREEGLIKIGDGTMAYLNRLSSVLYALARLVNHESGIKEETPTYQ